MKNIDEIFENLDKRVNFLKKAIYQSQHRLNRKYC